VATASVPKCGYNILQTSIPEAMVITDESDTMITNININFEPKVIGIGVGLGTSEPTIKAFGDFLKQNKTSLVIDADGINILAKDASLLEFLPKKTVFTPHPGELKGLVEMF